MGAQCSHTISPAYPDFREYTRSGDDGDDRNRWLLDEGVPGVEDSTWSCPHEVVPGYDKCPFHLPVADRPPELDVTAEFLHRIEASQEIDSRTAKRRKLQFIDATFGSFDIAGETLDPGTNYGINLAHATLAGVDLTDTQVHQQIRFSHATFEGASRFRNAQFSGFVGMRDADFRGPARFRGATFERPINIEHGTFHDDVYFWYTVFGRHANFRDVDFQGYAYFRGVDFNNYVRFSQAEFHDEAFFKPGEFGDDADFINAQFDGPHSFIDAEFERTTDFSGVTTSGPMDLSGATIETLEMTPDKIESDTQYVDLSGSLIETGELGQPDQRAILYDAHMATLGDVAVTTPRDEPVIEHIRMVSTNFDGFEFESDDMDPQAAGWRIHTVFDPSLLPGDKEETPSPAALRETYLKAKNGAKQAGNTASAGHFYYKEMTYRRKHLGNLVRSGQGDGIRTSLSWMRNLTLNLVTGYGEYPLRVIGTSTGAIIGFAALYDIIVATETSLAESILFSFQSFITFTVGSPPQGTTQAVAVISSLEGFVGAFFIALFVYAFTRRLDR